MSGNIANSSESENCQGNFQDLQKELVVLSYLMLRLTSQAATCFASLNGKFAKQTLPASSPMRRAFLLAKIPLNIVLLKAFSSGRSVSQATVEFALQTSSMRCKKRKIKRRTPHPSDSSASLRVCHLLPLEKAWLWFSPYNLVLFLLIVGDDVLGVPFV